MSYYSLWDKFVDIDNMLGVKLVKVGHDENSRKFGECIIFTADDGTRFVMFHSQDFCEHVYVESIVGDLQDLVGLPIAHAEEVEGVTHAGSFEDDYEPESYTRTFYKLATAAGWVDIRWLGTSNGYYSEGVDFARIPAEEWREEWTTTE